MDRDARKERLTSVITNVDFRLENFALNLIDIKIKVTVDRMRKQGYSDYEIKKEIDPMCEKLVELIKSKSESACIE